MGDPDEFGGAPVVLVSRASDYVNGLIQYVGGSIQATSASFPVSKGARAILCRSRY